MALPRFALGTQHAARRAATTEPAFDFAVDPMVSIAAGPVAAFVETGPSAFKLAEGPTHAGVAALVGPGAVLAKEQR